MGRPRVLSVGQCAYDHASISNVLARSFDAEVVAASTHDEAIEALDAGHFDLVLVNRVGDEDGASGIDLIRALKARPESSSLPIMLVSNYATAQAEARDLGALDGFGKSDLSRGREIPALRDVFQAIGR